MRILSQENLYAFGIIDLPYEMCALSMGYAADKSEFFIYVHFNGTKEQKIAKYSTEAKARKAMEMLREEYAGIPNIRRMDDLYGRFKHTGKKDFELFIEHIVLKKDYFQFPADDEVEV